jgi:hypothetical protein
MNEEGRDLTGVVVADEDDLKPAVVDSPGVVADDDDDGPNA